MKALIIFAILSNFAHAADCSLSDPNPTDDQLKQSAAACVQHEDDLIDQWVAANHPDRSIPDKYNQFSEALLVMRQLACARKIDLQIVVPVGSYRQACQHYYVPEDQPWVGLQSRDCPPSLNISDTFHCGYVAPKPPAPKFLEVERDAQGQIVQVSQAAAIEFCKTKGNAHLPTVREQAFLAESYGALGAWSLSEGPKDPFSQLVDARNADGTSDKFYFSAKDYQVNPAEKEAQWLWSSSTYAADSGIGFAFDSRHGSITDGGNRNYKFAFRCAANLN